MDKENLAHIHNGILFSHEKKESLPFATIWMNLEDIMLSEKSQKEKDKPYDLAHMLNLKRPRKSFTSSFPI